MNRVCWNDDSDIHFIPSVLNKFECFLMLKHFEWYILIGTMSFDEQMSLKSVYSSG